MCVGKVGPQMTQISPIQMGWNGMRTRASALRREADAEGLVEGARLESP